MRVTTAAVCGSDLHLLRGRMPGVEPGTVVGHEFVGVVEEVGAAVAGASAGRGAARETGAAQDWGAAGRGGAAGPRPGDRVVGPAAVWCGECRACRRGLPMACEHAAIFGMGARFGDLPGAQAEYVRVPHSAATLLPLPDGLTDEQALFVGDILPTAYTAVRGIVPGGRGVRAGDTVVVLGAGPVGLCAVACARLFEPARVIAVDLEPDRLALAARLGADVTVDAARDDVRAAVMEATDGWGADVVIEAVGRPETLADALRVAAPGGQVSIVGVLPEAVSVPFHRLMARNVAVAAGMGNLMTMPDLLGLVADGSLDLTPLITHRFPLAHGAEAYDLCDRRADGVIKVILEVGR